MSFTDGKTVREKQLLRGTHETDEKKRQYDNKIERVKAILIEKKSLIFDAFTTMLTTTNH